MFRSIWHRFSALLTRDRLARELDEELQEHYAALRQQLEHEGLSARAARGLAHQFPASPHHRTRTDGRIHSIDVTRTSLWIAPPALLQRDWYPRAKGPSHQ